MVQYRPFTTTIWVTLGMERMGGTKCPFMFFPRGGELKASLWLLPPALSLGSGVLFTVFLPWEQPKTLTGWHMLVGEERTEGE